MNTLEIKEIRHPSDLGELTKDHIIDFLYEHLGRFGDSKSAIGKAIDYAFSEAEGKGGFLLTAYYENKLTGVLVMNETGMSEYVPENILVYVAVDAKYRGKGFGRQIVEKSFEIARGDVKLHVEYENPAKRLYERVGMKTKYAEMRYERKK